MRSLYAYGNSVIGPYRQRASTFSTGALDFHRGAGHFYRRGIQVGGVKSGIVNFIIDVAHILLLAGGLYLLFTSIFG